MMNEEWLNALKVGDEVAIDNGRSPFGCRYSLDRVTAIHKLHILVGTRRFRKAGGWAVQRSSYFNTANLTAPTAEVREEIDRHNFSSRLSAVKFAELPVAKLRALAAVLDEGGA